MPIRREKPKDGKDLSKMRKQTKKQVTKNNLQGIRDLKFDMYRVKQMLTWDPIPDRILYLILKGIYIEDVSIRRVWLSAEPGILIPLVYKLNTTVNRYLQRYFRDIMRETFSPEKLAYLIHLYKIDLSMTHYSAQEQAICLTDTYPL